MKTDELEFLTLDQFIEKHPYCRLTEGSFAYAIRNREENGLLESGGIVKIGKSFYIRDKAFSEWYFKYVNLYRID